MTYWIRKFFSEPKAHLSALGEVVVVTFFLVAPFISLYLRQSATLADNTVFENGLLAKGQVFALIYGLSGSILYLAFASNPRNPPKTIIGFLCLFVLVPIIFMSGFDPSFRTLINARVNWLGHWAFVVFVFSYYALLLFEGLEPPSPEKSLRDGARDMAEAARNLD